MRLTVASGARADIHPTAVIAADARIQVLAGTLTIGARAVVGDDAVIVVRHEVRIGDGARLGDRVAVMDFGPTFPDVERPVRLQPLRCAPVHVGAGAIIGHGAVLEPGADVPAGARVEEHVVVG